MKRTGCDGERVCFIFDESNILDTAFLERMNALLASGEVPGLFEGDDHVALMSNVREAAGTCGDCLDRERFPRTSLTATHHPLTSMLTHPSPDFGPIIKAWGGLAYVRIS